MRIDTLATQLQYSNQIDEIYVPIRNLLYGLNLVAKRKIKKFEENLDFSKTNFSINYIIGKRNLRTNIFNYYLSNENFIDEILFKNDQFIDDELFLAISKNFSFNKNCTYFTKDDYDEKYSDLTNLINTKCFNFKLNVPEITFQHKSDGYILQIPIYDEDHFDLMISSTFYDKEFSIEDRFVDKYIGTLFNRFHFYHNKYEKLLIRL